VKLTEEGFLEVNKKEGGETQLELDTVPARRDFALLKISRCSRFRVAQDFALLKISRCSRFRDAQDFALLKISRCSRFCVAQDFWEEKCVDRRSA